MGYQEVIRPKTPGRRPTPGVAALLLLPVVLASAGAGGCVWENWNLLAKTPPPPPPPAQVMVLHPGQKQLEEVYPGESGQKFGGGYEWFRRGEYAKAEKVFHDLAEDAKKTPRDVAEASRYYESECLRMQGYYPKACDTYHKQLTDFPSGAHRDEARKRMFDIANFWLDDTRHDMEAARKNKDKWFETPGEIVHFERSKPLLDEQGRALEALQEVNYTDMRDPLSAEALFLEGSVHFYNQDYRDADQCFSQIVEMHKESKYAEKAVELSIIAKHMSTGGADYDGVKTAEAREMVFAAQNQYARLAAEKHDFLQRQLRGIDAQQGEKDLKMAEFYNRSGHPGAAYFYYEIVRRRYPGTPFFDKATERMNELAAKARKTKGVRVDSIMPPASPPGAAAPATPPGGMPQRLPEQLPTLTPPRPLQGIN